MAQPPPAPAALPPDFEWGFATAAYQVEGAVAEAGREPSIWDTFCHEPSHTKCASGDVASDHYHRYEQDFDLMSKYGANAYRFSISWSRIIPLGGRDDPVNEAGVAFYNRLIDALVRRNITPWVTLYHWDLPQALHDRYGGWLNVTESSRDFERYARVCFERFGDRVRNWITINEPYIPSIYGYATGWHAPGRSSTNKESSEGDSATEPWIVGKAFIMSHVRAVIAYKQRFQGAQRGRIGIALNGDFYEPWDSTDDRDKAAAEQRMEFYIGWFADPIFLKKDYPSCMRELLGERLPDFTGAELDMLREAETDFYGMNYYTAQFARHRDGPLLETDYRGNVEELKEDKNGTPIGDESGVEWLRVCPRQFQKLLARIHKRYGKPIYIMENGCPCPGEGRMTRDEAVDDAFRIRYFSSHLDAISRAVRDDGADVRGYFAWALIDSLEWAEGYGLRFGVTFVDFTTFERTPKKSALVLKGLIAKTQMKMTA